MKGKRGDGGSKGVGERGVGEVEGEGAGEREVGRTGREECHED